MDHSIKFENGHVYCEASLDGDEMTLYDSLEIYKEMKEYYKQPCIVTHWKYDGMETGRWVESQMTIFDAVWQMKEGWLNQASFKPVEDK